MTRMDCWKLYAPRPATQRIADTAIANRAVQKPRELAEFLSLLIGLDPQVIVEIGVHMGGTLYAWCQIAPFVFGIDESWRPSAKNWGATIVVGDSHQWGTRAELGKALDGKWIDCLYIDGDHTYGGVRRDYEMYAPLVRRGGLIAFHDISPILPGQINTEDIRVKRFWDEIKDESAVEIIDAEDHLRGHIAGFGIGVLTR
jgi:predicted O-methyltransferase YrrM